MKVALAQLNTHVGAIDANVEKVLKTARRARDDLGCGLAVFPELTLCGYPPEDLLFHRGMRLRVEAALEQVLNGVSGIAVYVGFPEYDGERIYNAGAFIADGRILALHRKIVLPNYSVFDEKRYFEPGIDPTVVEFGRIRFGLTICEDTWQPEPCRATVAAGADVILILNGSPFHRQKQQVREEVLAERAREIGRALVYVNMVGGQDELVFDGGSVVVTSAGEVAMRAPAYDEGVFTAELRTRGDGTGAGAGEDTDAGAGEGIGASDGDGIGENAGDGTDAGAGDIAPLLPHTESIYRALVMGTRDYVVKNQFDGVILGLSGGVDSALTMCVAVDALGAGHVHAVRMPSRYTSDMSLDDAAEQARRLGVRIDTLSIEPMFKATLGVLEDLFRGLDPDTTEENIQARCRGVLLMAISNKLGRMLLTTGNKSEMAVGYATLYGDMAGGFAPLKDCGKTLVYELARYRNRQSPVIPERVITRAPTAELRPDQKDSDSLPPYDVLDPILEAFIEDDLSVDQIAAAGFDRATVGRVLGMVKRNEYKRRQAPPGVRVSRRAFGRDWRYPITSGY